MKTKGRIHEENSTPRPNPQAKILKSCLPHKYGKQSSVSPRTADLARVITSPDDVELATQAGVFIDPSLREEIQLLSPDERLALAQQLARWCLQLLSSLPADQRSSHSLTSVFQTALKAASLATVDRN